MTWRQLWPLLLIGFFLTAASAAHDLPATTSEVPIVFVSTLFPPVYPALARQARIMGDVVLKLVILPDGRIESSEVMSGHPLLKQAALDSAKKSTFACTGCTDKVIHVLTYTFGLRVDTPCPQAIRKRSIKCLGLWRCGGWYSPPDPPAVIGESPDRVIILADSMCVETSQSSTN